MRERTRTTSDGTDSANGRTRLAVASRLILVIAGTLSGAAVAVASILWAIVEPGWVARYRQGVVDETAFAIVSARLDLLPALGLTLWAGASGLVTLAVTIAARHRRWLRRAVLLWPLGVAGSLLYAWTREASSFRMRPGLVGLGISPPDVVWPSLALGFVVAITATVFVIDRMRGGTGSSRWVSWVVAFTAAAVAGPLIAYGVQLR